MKEYSVGFNFCGNCSSNYYVHTNSESEAKATALRDLKNYSDLQIVSVRDVTDVESVFAYH